MSSKEGGGEIESGRIVRRAALDIGSGSTKYCVADVDLLLNSVLKIVLRNQFEVLVGHDLKKSKDGNLSKEILQQLDNALEEIQKVFASLDSPPSDISGVATAAYREAKNGKEWVESVKPRFNFPIRMISQREEGLLGFKTAVAEYDKNFAQKGDQNSDELVVSWDLGGASFQICCRPENSSSSSSDNHQSFDHQQELDQLLVFAGRWGASKATHAMVSEIQKNDFSKIQSANPVSFENFEDLLLYFKKDMEDAITENPVPPYLLAKLQNPQTKVVTFGDSTSTFKTASLGLQNAKQWTPENLHGLIRSLIGFTDQQIGELHLPQVEMVLPKLILHLAIMEYFQIPQVFYAETVGSTMGMFIHPPLWEN